MSKAPEEIFYETRQSLSGFIEPSPETGRMFEAGGRYALIADSLRREPLIGRRIIAELGCGKGDKLIYAKETFDFAQAVGVDLCFANKVIRGSGECEFFAANLNHGWPFKDKEVDVLVAMMLLEHLFDPFESFREIKRVLSPSGRAFVNLPLVTSFKNRLRLLVGRIPVTSVPYRRWQPEGHWDGFHLHYFSLLSIHDLAASAGLKIVRVTSVGRFHGAKNLLPCLLCDEISFELRHVH
jgi:SAM-dependent methyltransferase